ncbi:terminase [Corynebacterium auriscanis]|uniref:terminase n=1 Tax=Corynebacterium auriscanis TaxID=99807 RepID=UPI0024ADA518|nr:terminase [Corynebacterium auriscanis]
MTSATPRFHTPRDYRYPTLGTKVAKLSQRMGRPLMPWQQAAADVALEIDDRGRFRHERIVITVPRQSGKTALILALGLHRTLITPKGKIWYTAQTGQIARERFLKDMASDAEKLLGPAIAVKRGAGDTRLNFPAMESQFRPHPPNDTYLHSEQSDLNILDEPWAFSEVQGDGLIQAIQPTQNTRPNAQTIYLSTMGDSRSTWWHRIVDEARDGVPGTAIFDWGLPEAEDATDVKAVIRSHPAVGHTIEPDVVRKAAHTMKPAEFARAYANIRTQTRVSVFSSDVLARVLDHTATMTAGADIALGVAVAWDRSHAVIAAAGLAADGTPVCEIVDSRPGAGWVADRLKDLNERHHPATIMVDARSPASPIAADPALVDTIEIPTSAKVAAGTADFLDRIARGEIKLRWDKQLAKAFDVLALRTVGDLGQMLDRKNSAGSIAEIESAMLALSGITQAPAPAPAPEIWFA